MDESTARYLVSDALDHSEPDVRGINRVVQRFNGSCPGWLLDFKNAAPQEKLFEAHRLRVMKFAGEVNPVFIHASREYVGEVMKARGQA